MDQRNGTCTYSIYGLTLLAHQAIPGLLLSADRRPPDIRVDLIRNRDVNSQNRPKDFLYTSPGKTESGENFLQVWRQDDKYLCLRHNNGVGRADFVIAATGDRVEISATDGVKFNDAMSYFLGPVIGCVLRVRGITCLHASVLAVNGIAVAIIGAKGSGKSTVATEFAKRGYGVLSEDIAPLFEDRNDFYVHPGYPRLRLWRDTVEELTCAQPARLPRVLAQFDKYYLSLSSEPNTSSWRFHPERLPLGAIYLLEPGGRNAAAAISSVPSGEGLFSLISNTYADYVLDRVARASDFQRLGRLVNRVVVRRLKRPHAFGRLPDLCDAVLEDVQTLA